MNRDLEILRSGLANVGRSRVIMPRVTSVQRKRAEALYDKVMRGDSVIIASEPVWDLVYEADQIPDSATPAWTRDSEGSVTVTDVDGILEVEDDG